jgi:hypothetical protein
MLAHAVLCKAAYRTLFATCKNHAPHQATHKQTLATLAQEYFLEGAFRNVHTRLRTHAESVAFFGGGAREGGTIGAIFADVLAHLRGVVDIRCVAFPPSLYKFALLALCTIGAIFADVLAHARGVVVIRCPSTAKFACAAAQ